MFTVAGAMVETSIVVLVLTVELWYAGDAVVVLLMSDQGMVMDAGEPRIDGITVVTSTGLKLAELTVVTVAANTSAGEGVVVLVVNSGVKSTAGETEEGLSG